MSETVFQKRYGNDQQWHDRNSRNNRYNSKQRRRSRGHEYRTKFFWISFSTCY
nr:MAG TPA: Somatostatin/Cortistatin family [Caudoviricetes sp.]